MIPSLSAKYGHRMPRVADKGDPPPYSTLHVFSRHRDAPDGPVKHPVMLNSLTIEKQTPRLGQIARRKLFHQRCGDPLCFLGGEIGPVQRVVLSAASDRPRVRPVHVYMRLSHVADGERRVEAIANTRKDVGLSCVRPE